MKHLFEDLKKIRDILAQAYTMLFLDYDGTLVPIVESPDKAVMPEEIKGVLVELSKAPKCKIAIVSGRSLKDIKNIVGLSNILYVGNHGLEAEGGGIKFESPVSWKYKTILSTIKNNLNKKLSLICGAFVEDKGLSLAVHYRRVDKKFMPLVKAIFRETTAKYLVKKEIKIRRGKMVLEIRPPVEWDKGRIILWLLARRQLSSDAGNILSFYMGDDVTDEDAFKALKNKGITVFVGKHKVSRAKYYLNDSEEVKEFLKRILEFKKVSV